MKHKTLKSMLLVTLFVVCSMILVHTGFIAEANQPVIGPEPVPNDWDYTLDRPYINFEQEEKTKMGEAFDSFFNDWRKFLAFVAGFGALTSLLAFIVLMLKLGASADNPAARSAIMRDLLIAMVVTALLGGSSIILALFVQIVSL